MSRLPRSVATSLLPLAISLAACGVGGEEEVVIFADPAGYSLTVPRGWSLSDHTAEDGLIRADIDKGNEMGIQVRLMRMSSSGFASRTSSLLSSYREEMSRHWGGGLVETERSAPNAGDGALTVGFQASRGDGSVWYLQESFVSEGEMLVVLQGGCLWEDREQARRAFHGIVESISFP